MSAEHTFTHRQLCELAVGWLRRPASRQGPGCQVAFSESRSGYDGEIPDAIGFRAGVYKEASVIVEAKASRSDFAADLRKRHRGSPETGMGLYRYYIVPAGLVTESEIPDGWGLIEARSGGRLRVACGHVLLRYGEEDTWRHQRAIEREWTILTLMLSRVGDVEKTQRMLKEARNGRNRNAEQVARLREEVRTLRMQLHTAHLSQPTGERV